jgi:hypothetical protein
VIEALAHPSRLRRSHVAILCVILVLAAALRLGRLGQPVYLLDEIWHAELSTGRGSVHMELPRDRLMIPSDRPTSFRGAPPWHEVWTHLRGATHPPLYLLTLRLWRAALGEGEATSRALSVLASLIAIVLLFDAARHLSTPRAALWAAALFAVAGPQVALARELRGYALTEMWALGAAAAVARIDRLGFSVRRGVALFACALAALLTHYFAALAMLALGIYALAMLRARARWISCLLLSAALAAFLLVWLPQLLQQRRAVPGLESGGATVHLNWLSDTSDHRVLRAIKRFGELPLRLLVDPPAGYGALGWLGLLPLVLASTFVAVRRDRALVFWLLWFTCTAGGLLALDLARSTRHLEFIRYSLIAGAGVCAIVPLLAPRTVKLTWFAAALPGAATLFVAICLPLAYVKPTPDLRAVAQYLDENLSSGDIVAFFPAEGMDWYAGNASVGVAHYSRTFPWPTIILSKPADDQLLSQLRGRNVWLFSGSSRIPATEIIPRARPTQRQYFDATGTVTRLSVEP